MALGRRELGRREPGPPLQLDLGPGPGPGPGRGLGLALGSSPVARASVPPLGVHLRF